MTLCELLMSMRQFRFRWTCCCCSQIHPSMHNREGKIRMGKHFPPHWVSHSYTDKYIQMQTSALTHTQMHAQTHTNMRAMQDLKPDWHWLCSLWLITLDTAQIKAMGCQSLCQPTDRGQCPHCPLAHSSKMVHFGPLFFKALEA